MRTSKKFLMGVSLLVSALSTSCGMMIPSRSYVDQMDRESDSFFKAGKDFPIMSGDTGQAFRSKEEIKKRTPASAREKVAQNESASLKQELMEKEGMLSEDEMAEYNRDSKYLPSESDKLYYLSLSGEDRIIYLQSKKQDFIEDHGVAKDLAKQQSIHATQIYLGMTKDEVIKSWGRPNRVQYAGNPKYQNELWLFNEDGSVKQVFFEGGKVNGWALDL